VFCAQRSVILKPLLLLYCISNAKESCYVKITTWLSRSGSRWFYCHGLPASPAGLKLTTTGKAFSAAVLCPAPTTRGAFTH
jgi:hypothetical protein